MPSFREEDQMCHGHIDPKFLMQDAQARTRDVRVPRLELGPAIKGAFARLIKRKPDAAGTEPVSVPAE
ncbi:MAG: hypothetical protein RIB61_06990 [Roseicyclus sp.]